MPTIESEAPVANDQAPTFSSGAPVDEWLLHGARPVRSKQIAKRFAEFLTDRRPAAFCDDCMAHQLGLNDRRQANKVSRALAMKSAFWRTVGACSVCHKYKQVIRHV
jgi:hypothetical protein